MKGDETKGHLELLILAVLDEGSLHGYAVIERLRQRSGGTFDLAEGTVYPALHRLENAGLLASSWSEHGGRKRKVYQLTSGGRDALATRRDAWKSFAAAVGKTLGGRTWPATA